MENPLDILKAHWGYDSFRVPQEEIIRSVLSGKDTVALLPTGGGKSICFQVPGLAREGLTLVISPLIALMKDQVANLRDRGIPAAEINSSLGYQEIESRLQGAMDGKYKFLYLAPERIETEIFLHRLPEMNVRLIAIDEAHCISQWGYDFRPAYLRIRQLRDLLPGVPMIALTATATPRVQEDIIEQLALHEAAVFTKSFRRENLSYQVIETGDFPGTIQNVLETLDGSGIVYARTRKNTVRLAEFLQKAGISASAYHGGMKAADRARIQEGWIRNEIRVITATNAFGMGIDKPDVRFVMHFQLPLDLESYYQEAGRAGRDGEPAVAIAFVNDRERADLEKWAAQKYPEWETLKHHYESICNYFAIPNTGISEQTYALDLLDISKKFNHNPLLLYNSIRLLDREGLLVLNERPEGYGWIKMRISPREVLRYKDSHPEMESLIDFILRTLGGDVYWEEMRFLPFRWGKKLQMTPEYLVEKLNFLKVQGVIQFRPPREEPTVKFLTPRVRLQKAQLNWDTYAFLRKQQEKRLAALLAYMHSPGDRCRSAILEAYFGEKPSGNCGKCDVCRANRAEGSKEIPRKMKQMVVDHLRSGATGYRELIGAIPIGTDVQKRIIIQELLDEGIIIRNNVFLISLPGKSNL